MLVNLNKMRTILFVRKRKVSNHHICFVSRSCENEREDPSEEQKSLSVRLWQQYAHGASIAVHITHYSKLSNDIARVRLVDRQWSQQAAQSRPRGMGLAWVGLY